MKYYNLFFLFNIIPFLTFASKINSCIEDKTIALTFDDGPFKYTEELINILNENDIHATFFINVENYWKDLQNNKDKQKILKKAHDSGHQIASHTWKHYISSDINEFDSMMNKTDSWIENVIGDRPAYFRAPRGECYSECVEYLEEKKYKLIQWDTDTNDWDISSGASYRAKRAKSFLNESFEYKRSNYLILMHDVYEHTVREIVPWIINNKPKGYKFVTVAECLGDKSSMYRTNKVVSDELKKDENEIEKVKETKFENEVENDVEKELKNKNDVKKESQIENDVDKKLQNDNNNEKDSQNDNNNEKDSQNDNNNKNESQNENEAKNIPIIEKEENGYSLNNLSDNVNNDNTNNDPNIYNETNNDNNNYNTEVNTDPMNNFNSNTVINNNNNDDNQGNLVYESSTLSFYKNNKIIVFLLTMVLLKIFVNVY